MGPVERHSTKKLLKAAILAAACLGCWAALLDGTHAARSLRRAVPINFLAHCEDGEDCDNGASSMLQYRNEPPADLEPSYLEHDEEEDEPQPNVKASLLTQHETVYSENDDDE